MDDVINFQYIRKKFLDYWVLISYSFSLILLLCVVVPATISHMKHGVASVQKKEILAFHNGDRIKVINGFYLNSVGHITGKLSDGKFKCDITDLSKPVSAVGCDGWYNTIDVEIDGVDLEKKSPLVLTDAEKTDCLNAK